MAEIESEQQLRAEGRILGLGRNVFVLGLVSFLTDISSEMTVTILPLFLANVLGVRTPIIGLVEGIADSTASILKVFSGWFSDRLQKRKSLTAIGYSLSAFAKPFLYLATTWGVVLGVRFTDRVGKGIRTSPRDALISESTPEKEMGKSFGYHRAMDTLGAVVGLSVAALIVYLLQRGSLDLARDTYQTLVLFGMVPGLLAVLLVIRFVTERQPVAARSGVGARATGLSLSLKGFDARFKALLVIIVLFNLGNSSDAFLILRAQNLGLSVLQIFVLLVLFNIFYAVVAMPAGMLSDRIGRKAVIIGGWLAYIVIYLGFGFTSSLWQVWLLFVAYGFYYGATEGVARAFVADWVPSERRGIAYGLYHTAVGITVFPASVIAGWLWQVVSPSAPFFFGAAMAGLAVVLLASLGERPDRLFFKE